MLYISMRFKWRMAAGAIVANLHDVVFILGLFSLFRWEFNLPVLAATLAILGYSVNESVVIFDRVRENFRSQRKAADAADMLDISITQTWARTIITHGSTQLAVLSMLFFWRRRVVFVCAGADHRHFFQHLFLGANQRPDCVAFGAEPRRLFGKKRQPQSRQPLRRGGLMAEGCGGHSFSLRHFSRHS